MGITPAEREELKMRERGVDIDTAMSTSIVAGIESKPADFSGGMQERRLAMLSGVQSRFWWARGVRRIGWVVMTRIRGVINAGGEEVVVSFSFRLRKSVGVVLVDQCRNNGWRFSHYFYNFPERHGV